MLVTGLAIAAQSTLQRMRTIVVWVLTKGAALLLKLPMASLRFLANLGGYLLEGRNRKILVILVTTAAVVTASR